jgi:hypothetical protein
MKVELWRIWKEVMVGLNLRKGTVKNTINFSEDNHVPAEIPSKHLRNTISDSCCYTIPLSTKYFLYFFRYQMCILILSVFIPITPTWSIERPWNALFHFNFLILDSRYDSLDGGSAHRKAATNTGQYKHRIHADNHPCLEWDSNPRSQCSSDRRQFMP